MSDWLKHLTQLTPEQVATARASEVGAESWLLSNSLLKERDILRAKSLYFGLP